MLFIAFFAILAASSTAQGFECDESMYVIVYTESVGESVLYQIWEDDDKFSSQKIPLSQKRRLTSLVYNVLDKHLYALDVNSYELVKINRAGQVETLVVPGDIDRDYLFHSGTISPDGSGIYMIGYDKEFAYDNKFYTINLSRENYYAGFLGVTGENKVEVHDFATDPTSGLMYGYDNIEGRLVQISVGGLISSLDYPTTGIQSVDGLFFNQSGELFAFAANRGFYKINIQTGVMEFLERGPEGTNGDGCSCPYTSEFEKTISPKQILPCEEFEVTYRFYNSLGIGQTWVKLRDTFPEGFEIVNIESSIIQSHNILDSPTNVLALDNIIYLMRENLIRVTVRAPETFQGNFESQAVHWDFPAAFGEFQYTDDPTTVEENDATRALVGGASEIEFSNSIEYDCEGKNAIIAAPVEADRYEWSTGDTGRSITVDTIGWYGITAYGECTIYIDSIFVGEYPPPKEVEIIGQSTVVLGESTQLSASLSRGIPVMYSWTYDNETIECLDCSTIDIFPAEATTVFVQVRDEDGCITENEMDIDVEILRNFYAPTAFSPNEDGINDHFYLQSNVPGTIIEISVFNRWGNEVFYREDVPINLEESGWNGKSNSDPMPSGVYIWMAKIEYFDGFSETKSGSITLIGQN